MQQEAAHKLRAWRAHQALAPGWSVRTVRATSCGVSAIHSTPCAQSLFSIHCAYVFANRRADRLKMLVYDGSGMWLCMGRLQAGSSCWPREDEGLGALELTREQLDWLVAGLPWQRLSARAPLPPITAL